MEILYKEEHLACPNYNKGKRPLAEVRIIGGEPPFEEHSRQYKIVFVLEGEIVFRRLEEAEIRLCATEMLLVPPDKWYGICAKDEAKILIIRLQQIDRLCEYYFTDKLIDQGETESRQLEEPYRMKINQMIDTYLSTLVIPIEKGLKCKRFFEIKIKELFYLLRAFYTKEELRLFFSRMLSSDTSFFYFVRQNYNKYKSVAEFAAALNMSSQSFERRFKTVFKSPPYTWIKQQRAANIYHAICTEETPLKELANRFGFASKSSFSDFCRKNLGKTPGNIRREMHFKENEEQNEKNG